MKKGLLSFIFGSAAGGLFAMTHSKRKGSELKADLLKNWKKGKTGLDVLWKDVQDMTANVTESYHELSETEAGKKIQKKIEKSYENAKKAAAKAKDELEAAYKEAMDEMGVNAKKTVKKATKQVKKAATSAKKAATKTINNATPKKTSAKK